ncbi:MAG: DUF1934 domain-containing protein [Clostridia bacterium]|nr:DUF1934 domain-containing protein [Clostridia bacterium]
MDGENEQILFNAVGYMERTGNNIKIKYAEPRKEDEHQSFSTLQFAEDKRKEVYISRSGAANEMFCFIEGQRYMASESLPFGELTLFTDTKSVKNSINYNDGGKLEIKYTIDSQGMLLEEVHLSITVK